MTLYVGQIISASEAAVVTKRVTCQENADAERGPICPARRRPTAEQDGTNMRLDLSLRVLVVDDFNTMTRIICNILKQIGYQNVEMVNSGNEALAKLRAEKFSIVISDWNMESMSGYDLLKEIRSDEKLANVCFIMISAEPSISRVVEAKKA